MSTALQSTPNRLHPHSPQSYPKSRRQQTSHSPYGKRYPQTSITKSIMSTKRNNDELNQKNEKIREFETKTSRLEERLTQYEQEKEALQNTLKERVQMYKRIIKQKEEKSQRTLQSIQAQFRLQMKQLSQEKQQEERFFEQQTQIMGQKIQILQDQNYELRQKVAKQLNLYSDLNSEIEKLKMENLALKNQYNLMVQEKGTQIDKLQANIAKLNDQFKQQRATLKNDTEKKIQQLTASNKSLQQRLETQLRGIENLRQSQTLFRDNEIAQLKRMLETERLKFAHTLEAEKLRNDHLLQTETLKNQKYQNDSNAKSLQEINTKQSVIDAQSRDIAQLEHELSQSTEQNSSLKQQINQLNAQMNLTQKDLIQCTQLFAKEKGHLISIIDELRQEIKLNQLNYIHEKNRNEAVCGENIRLHQATSDRELLLSEIAELRQLLMESSKQIQICRERFLTFDRENKRLMFELERVGAENNTLLRVRRDLEEEAIKWRQNYLRVAR